MSLDLIQKIIEEEVRNALDYAKPSEVETVEDAWAGGEDLEEPIEHVPADVPADVEVPQAKVGPIKDIKNENVVKIDISQLKSIVDECVGDDIVTPEIEIDTYAHTDDHEGKMAKSQLYQAAKNAHSIYQMIDNREDLPSWVQSKLTKAADYLQTVYNHLDHKEHGSTESVISGGLNHNED
jgi:hypothetical protein